jgi:hypothetical protein
MKTALFLILSLTLTSGASAAEQEINNDVCYTPPSYPRVFDQPDEVAARDAVEAQIGGTIDSRHVASGQASATDVVNKRAALKKLWNWAIILPESRIKKAYLCAIERQGNALDDAAQELVTHKFQKQHEAHDSVVIPFPPK